MHMKHDPQVRARRTAWQRAAMPLLACIALLGLAAVPAQARSHGHHGARVHGESTAGQFDY